MQVNVRPAHLRRWQQQFQHTESQRRDKLSELYQRNIQPQNSSSSPQLESTPTVELEDAQKVSISQSRLFEEAALQEGQNYSHVEPVETRQADQRGWQEIVWQLMPNTPVGRALVSATQRLESHDIDTAHLDAQVILAHVLGVDRPWLFAHHEVQLSEEQAERFTELIVRRMKYEPVAYLIGKKEFYGLEFVVDQRVLIPRPETELLVDAILNYLDMRSDDLPLGQQLRMVDVGTGCGAIALSVAENAPDVQVFAIDISRDALEIARTNVRRLDKRCQVCLLEGDLLDPLGRKADASGVDIIAANLPYINKRDYQGLAPDIRNFEPQVALEAGPKGLDSIGRLLTQAPKYLNPNGFLILEIGHDQGEEILSLIECNIPQARFVDLRQDYSGKDRLVTVAL